MEENLGSIYHLKLESEPVAMVTPPEGGAMEMGSSGRKEEGMGDQLLTLIDVTRFDWLHN